MFVKRLKNYTSTFGVTYTGHDLFTLCLILTWKLSKIQLQFIDFSKIVQLYEKLVYSSLFASSLLVCSIILNVLFPDHASKFYYISASTIFMNPRITKFSATTIKYILQRESAMRVEKDEIQWIVPLSNFLPSGSMVSTRNISSKSVSTIVTALIRNLDPKIKQDQP